MGQFVTHLAFDAPLDSPIARARRAPPTLAGQHESGIPQPPPSGTLLALRRSGSCSHGGAMLDRANANTASAQSASPGLPGASAPNEPERGACDGRGT
jgi:hypothetical protein